jgi:hypothetical protein
MSQYILLIRGGNPDDSNREELGAKWGEWLEKAKADGKYQSGLPFSETGNLIDSSGSSEYKSDIGAYMVMEHANIEEAQEWASKLPNIGNGGSASVHAAQSMG